MPKRLALLIAAAVLLAALAACGFTRKPKPPIIYYTLNYEAPRFPDTPKVPVVVRVARFSEAADNNLTQMLYSQGPSLRNEYYYQRWRAMPGDLASSYLLRDMQQCDLFSAAVSGDSAAQAAYRVEGRVEKFYELDLPEAWQADLSLTVTLLRETTKSASRLVVFQKTYEAMAPAAEKTPQALAEAMGQAMAQVSRSIIQDVYDAARDDASPPAAKPGQKPTNG